MADQSSGNGRGDGRGGKLGDFAETIAYFLVERITQRAADAGGRLRSGDFQAVLKEFTYSDDPSVRKLCDTTWATMQHQFEEAFYARMRTHPLERLMVARFVHLLPDRGAAPVPDRTLSRRVIPAFSQALNQMVGPELFDEYETRAREMIEALRARQGDDFDWERLHEQPVARILVNDILIYIARYFTDIPKRRAWMVSFFDRTMPGPKTDAEKAWTFGDMEFHKLMSALYSDLGQALGDPAARQELSSRYDEASLSQLEQILAGLAQDQRRVLSEQ